MAGISSKAAGTLQNKFQFLDREKQSNEFSDGSGLEEYDLGARFYDPQIGRFHSIDPLCEYMRRWSPYSYGFDNPLRFADGNGMAAGDSTAKPDPDAPTPGSKLAEVKTLENVTVSSHKKSSGGFWSSVGNFLWDAADYVPFAGSIKQIGMGIYHGDWKEIGDGALMLTVDALTVGEGGEAIRVGKVLVEDEVKEIVEKEFIEQTEKKTFDEARLEAFEKAGIKDGEFDMVKATEKEDPKTGTLTEFKGNDGAKVGYDAPHKSPGPHHDKQHISWQSGGKRGAGGTKRGNIPYDGPRHPSRPLRK